MLDEGTVWETTETSAMLMSKEGSNLYVFMYKRRDRGHTFSRLQISDKVQMGKTAAERDV